MGTHHKLRFWTHSGVKVYDNTAAPTSWTDLDLSSIVGENRALVFLKIQNMAIGSPETFYFRRGDDTEDVGEGGSNAGGNSVIKIGSECAGHVLMETDANGVIEWKSPGGEITDVWIVGYVK